MEYGGNFEISRQEYASKVFGTDDKSHPGVAKIFVGNECAIAGKLTAAERDALLAQARTNVTKLVAGTAVSILQVYAFLFIAYWWEIEPPPLGYLGVLPALILSGLMLGALGMLISSAIKQLENFAGVMNFVIFPMFFASSALYPLWRIKESSPALYYLCQFNPFTHAVELIRFALYLQVNWLSLAVVAGCTAAFMLGAVMAYDPARGLLARRGEGA